MLELLALSSLAGYRGYDNILYAWLVCFQHMTATDWTLNMYDLADGVNWWTWIYNMTNVSIEGGSRPLAAYLPPAQPRAVPLYSCPPCHPQHMIGGILIVNLVLAVLYLNFIKDRTERTAAAEAARAGQGWGT